VRELCASHHFTSTQRSPHTSARVSSRCHSRIQIQPPGAPAASCSALASCCAPMMNGCAISGVAVIVPVPLHPARQRNAASTSRLLAQLLSTPHFIPCKPLLKTLRSHHHANRARLFRTHGKFTQRIPFTKKRRRARLARVVNRRCPHNRLYVERMRAVLKRAGAKVDFTRHCSTRMIPWAIFKKPAIKAQAGKKREMPIGVFQKCPGCGQVVPEMELGKFNGLSALRLSSRAICPSSESKACSIRIPS